MDYHKSFEKLLKLEKEKRYIELIIIGYQFIESFCDDIFIEKKFYKEENREAFLENFHEALCCGDYKQDYKGEEYFDLRSELSRFTDNKEEYPWRVKIYLFFLEVLEEKSYPFNRMESFKLDKKTIQDADFFTFY